MQSPGVAGAADHPYGITYTTEVGEVLFSLQALLLRESRDDVLDVSFSSPAEPKDELPRWALDEDLATATAPDPIPLEVSPAGSAAAEVTVLPEALPPAARHDGFGYGGAPEPAPALFDLSTGAPTYDSLVKEIERQGSRISAGLVALDVTPLAEIRARHGEDVAEGILRAIVEAVPFALRAEDHIYRTGVDELTLCVPGTNLSDAAAMSLRLQMAVKDVLVRRELPPVILSIRPYQQAAA